MKTLAVKRVSISYCGGDDKNLENGI